MKRAKWPLIAVLLVVAISVAVAVPLTWVGVHWFFEEDDDGARIAIVAGIAASAGAAVAWASALGGAIIAVLVLREER